MRGLKLSARVDTCQICEEEYILPTPTNDNGYNPDCLDFDLHGIIRIRLKNASEGDALAVKKQLGLSPVACLDHSPDITISFEKFLPLPRLTFLGLNDAGFTDDGFFLLRSKKAKAKVRIPFDQIGNRCEILCESGVRAVPLLIPILNLTLLNKGYISLHATAFTYEGLGILVTGWAKGGKTESLLAFTSHGATYVGDEWVILSRNGEQMYGLPEPIRIWDWQIEQLPKIRSQVPNSRRVLFKAIHMIGSLHKRFGSGVLKKSFPFVILDEAMPALNRQLHVTLPPEKILHDGMSALSAKPQIVFFIMSHDDPSIRVNPYDATDVSRRMRHSVRYEQLPFFEYYEAFKFAFPEAKNEFLENVEEIQSDILTSALGGKKSYQVLHPYPVNLEALFHEMQAVANRAVSSFSSQEN